ncbi:hypothetical protein K445DRAFT_148673 [Daldinia sp. EC12]|nr:hypothetical protein K445DRAFT_148673 [Daldinia sp. EC12]
MSVCTYFAVPAFWLSLAIFAYMGTNATPVKLNPKFPAHMQSPLPLPSPVVPTSRPTYIAHLKKIASV